MLLVRDAIRLLQERFDPDFPLVQALVLICTFFSVLPLYRLHRNQQAGRFQRENTAWWNGIQHFVQQTYFVPPEGAEDEQDYWDNSFYRFAHDMQSLFGELEESRTQDLPEKILTTRILLATERRNCIICTHEQNSLRKRGRLSNVVYLDEHHRSRQAVLAVATCIRCHAEYYPDRITFLPRPRERVQRLEYHCTYLRVSRHGVWIHRKLAEAQERAVFRFRVGWANYAAFLNDTYGANFITVRQSQRMFLEHFGRRLIVAHQLEEQFTCPAHPSPALFARSLVALIGKDGGVVAGALLHTCPQCTHAKRFRTDLSDAGAVLENNISAVADMPTENAEEDGMPVSYLQKQWANTSVY